MDDAQFMAEASELLRVEMVRKRITQRRLAKLSGISLPTVGRHFRGESPMSQLQTCRYAEVLGVDPASLLPRLDSNQQPVGLSTQPEKTLAESAA